MPTEEQWDTPVGRAVAGVGPDKRREAEANMLLQEVIRQGRGKYGAEQFDTSLRTVAEKIGVAKSFVFRDAIFQSDKPAEVIHDLGNDERRLDEIAKVADNPFRLARALGEVERKFNPHGRVNTSADPDWVRNRGRATEADFKHGRAYETASDAELDRHLAERAKFKRERGW